MSEQVRHIRLHWLILKEPKAEFPDGGKLPSGKPSRVMYPTPLCSLPSCETKEPSDFMVLDGKTYCFPCIDKRRDRK